MSVNSKMTTIADKIRALLGLSGTMGLDAMATNLGTEQTNIANAFTAVGNKGGTVPSSKVSGNLTTAINSIPTNTGVTVQIKTGTVTGVSGSAKTVNVGFKPDAVFITGKNPQDNNAVYHAGAAFTQGNVTSTKSIFAPPSGYYVMTTLTLTQTSTGFSVKGTKIDASFSPSNESDRSLDYIAIKYTK